MSGYRVWRKYGINESDDPQIEAYLRRKVWRPEVSISMCLLLDSTHMQKAPESTWYALHYLSDADEKWNHDVMAWGLNITESDLATIRREVAHIFTAQAAMAIGDTSVSATDLTAIDSRGQSYIFDEIIEKFETLYSEMEARSVGVRVPRFWRESAMHAFALECSTTARRGIRLPSRPKCAHRPPAPSSELSTSGAKPHVSLNFDCVDRIFGMSGLKLGSMRALARVWGFNNAEVESLIKRRCNPIALFGELVVDPERFRSMMHDCDVILTGPRAVGFFWPSASTANSAWSFVTHPHVSHWLKFAAYLSSIGVEFDFPASIEDGGSVNTSGVSGLEQEHHSAVKVLSGTVWHKGRRHQVRLAAHLEHPKQQSSIQEVLQLHSSVDQCLITGFAAVCMYAQQTTTGQSHIWRVGGCHDSGPRVKAQRQIDRYIERGISFTQPRSHKALDPRRIPEPRLRKLGDGGALCISFEQYVQGDKAELVRSDFNLLREIAWWEECHTLKCVRQARGSFWSLDLEDSWAERAILRAGRTPRVPLFDSLMDVLQCTRCQINDETLCKAHESDLGDSPSVQLLFFCLRNVERRRMSWNFLGLDFRWDECWEYPYI